MRPYRAGEPRLDLLVTSLVVYVSCFVGRFKRGNHALDNWGDQGDGVINLSLVGKEVRLRSNKFMNLYFIGEYDRSMASDCIGALSSMKVRSSMGK